MNVNDLFDPLYSLLDQGEFVKCASYINSNPSILRYSLGRALLAYAYASSGSKQMAKEIAL
jgi:hypothetical protein